MVLDLARRDPICRRLMTAPGVGPVVALTYRTVIDNSIDVDQVYPGQEPKLHFLAFPARETPEFDGRAFLPRLCRITPVEGQHLRWGPAPPMKLAANAPRIPLPNSMPSLHKRRLCGS